MLLEKVDTVEDNSSAVLEQMREVVDNEFVVRERDTA